MWEGNFCGSYNQLIVKKVPKILYVFLCPFFHNFFFACTWLDRVWVQSLCVYLLVTYFIYLFILEPKHKFILEFGNFSGGTYFMFEALLNEARRDKASSLNLLNLIKSQPQFNDTRTYSYILNGTNYYCL